MGRVLIISGIAWWLAACSNPAPPPSQPTVAPSLAQCGKDTDCKGDRICDAGKCIAPAQAAVIGEKGPARQVAGSVEPKPSTDPVPVCKAGDGRTKIPVWRPSVNDDGNLSSDPPQKDGQIVYIRLHQDASKTECGNELNSFSRPENPKDAMQGGLAVNLRGNTQTANGTCYFSGYYMNEDVMGVHQGWTETFYGAVSKQDIVTSGKYCLSESVE
jgi:hypothetical protein